MGLGTSDRLVRTEYMIDRHRVVYESGGGWHCECDEFKSAPNVATPANRKDVVPLRQ